MSDPKETTRIVRALMEKVKVGIMSTVDGDKPCTRPMAAFPMSDNEIWFATFKDSRKVKQIQSNPNMELCFMDGEFNHVRLSGAAAIVEDAEIRSKLWDLAPDIGSHFKSVDDPNYVVIQFIAKNIAYLEHGLGKKPQVVQF